MASTPNNLDSTATDGGAPRCRIDQQDQRVDAEFDSDPAHLAAVRTAIESLCNSAGFDAKATAEIGLVVNEAIANIIRHAYGSAADQPVQLHAHVNREGGEFEIEINLRDWGNGKLPAGLGKPQPADPLTPPMPPALL